MLTGQDTLLWFTEVSVKRDPQKWTARSANSILSYEYD